MGGFSTNFDTGLLDDYDFTVTRAWFEGSEMYDGVSLKLEGTTDSLDLPVITLYFSCGKAWSTKDGGKTIVHTSGKDGKNFNANVAYAKVIRRCLEDFNIGDLLNSRGNPWTAETWVGLRFHINNEVMEYGKDSGIDPKSKAMPSAFLGVVDDAAVDSPADKIARLKATKAAGSLRDQVLDTLRQHTEFTAGQAAALEIDGVTDDDDILSGLMDADGLWAEANA